MEKGFDVRGTNSRGAKDIAALGDVTFQSVAKADGRVHTCMISRDFFIKFEKSKGATRAVRKSIGIDSGTGTRVTIALIRTYRFTQHDKLVQRIQNLVALRDILSDAKRSVILWDSAAPRASSLKRLCCQASCGSTKLSKCLDIRIRRLSSRFIGRTNRSIAKPLDSPWWNSHQVKACYSRGNLF